VDFYFKLVSRVWDALMKSGATGSTQPPSKHRPAKAPKRNLDEDEFAEGFDVETAGKDEDEDDDTLPASMACDKVLFRLHGNLPQVSRQETLKYACVSWERCALIE
jgi:hypothetical protein